MATAAVSLNPCSADRPTLISRHSSCLPLIHARPAGRNGSRRCRSASPPIKKKTNKPTNDMNMAGRVIAGADERFTDTRQNEDRFRISSSEIPRLLYRQPIIKQLSNSYSVKQPRPGKVSHKVLPDRSNPVLSTADLNGNLIRSNSYCLPGDISKSRRLGFARHFTLPTDAYRQCGCHSAEPLRKRKSSFTNISAPLTGPSTAGIHSLPAEIKLKIFSYLSHMEKGRCMSVCKDWYSAIKQPELWRVINFRQFTFCYGHQKEESVEKLVAESLELLEESDMHLDSEEYRIAMTALHEPRQQVCNQTCYVRYIYRIEGFIAFLIDLQPRIRWLAFSFDLISDNWWATIHKFLLHTNLSALKYADINWRDTPTKPYYLDQGISLALNDIINRTKRRERKFYDFLDLFTQEAANLETLIMPFVWIDRSLNRLTSFKKLKNLSLEKYFVLKSLSQNDLDFLLSRLPGLERLLINVWSGCKNPLNFIVRSPSLRYLDISQCRSLYICELKVPALEVLVMPTNQITTSIPDLPAASPAACLVDLIRAGAPSLKRFNHISLRSLSDLDTSGEVSDLLYKVCRCRQHRPLETYGREDGVLTP